MIWTASRICRSEFPKGSPCQSETIVRLERPSPRATRPGATWPRLAAETPRTTGVRGWTGVTAGPPALGGARLAGRGLEAGDPGGAPGGGGGGGARVPRRLERGVGRLEGGGEPRRCAPVVRSDVAGVDAGDGEDRVDVRHGVHVLDLGDDEDLVVRASEVGRGVGLEREREAPGAEASHALGRVLARPDEQLRFFARANVRREHTPGAGVEHPLDVRFVERVDADERRARITGDRRE